MPEISDQEDRSLVSISESLKKNYADSSEGQWHGSPFSWILSKPSRQKGKIGEELVSTWCASKGLEVGRSPNSDSDRVIEGKKIEIKFSTLWENGQYKFQQIRDQDYDYLFCLGISPFAVHAWIMKKEEMPLDIMPYQHGGSEGRDTRWLTVRPDNIPGQLNKFGGSLSSVLKILKSISDE